MNSQNFTIPRKRSNSCSIFEIQSENFYYIQADDSYQKQGKIKKLYTLYELHDFFKNNKKNGDRFSRLYVSNASEIIKEEDKVFRY